MYGGNDGWGFAGRHGELRLLTEAVTSSVDRPRLVTVTGEAGTGKSRLLAELHAVVALSQGTTVLRQATAEQIAAATGDRVVAITDDLHDADPATIAGLEELLAHPPRPDLLLVLAYRPRQVATRLLAAVTADLRWAATHVRLGPLSRAVVEELLPARLCATHRMSAFDHSGGNPRYLKVLLALCQGERCRGGSLLGADVPPEALAPVQVELDPLSPAATLVGQAAAVVGETFDLELTAAVAELDRPAVLVAVDELLGADLIRSGGVPGTFHFRHPVLRGVTYRSAPDGWRLGAHARAADALRARNEPATRLAEHIQFAGGTGGADGAEVLAEAAKGMEITAPQTAASWYQAALRLFGDRPEHRDRRLELRLALASTAVSTGAVDLAARALAERDDELRSGIDDDDAAAAAIVCRARLALLAGRYTEARAMLRTGIEQLGGSPEAARLRLMLACTTAWDTGWEWSEDALLSAIGTGDTVLQILAVGVHAMAALTKGMTDVAHRSTTEAARLVDRKSDEDLARQLMAVSYVAWSELLLERWDAAADHFARGLAVARAFQQWQMAMNMLLGLASVNLHRGRLPVAHEQADQAVGLARTPGNENPMAMALALRAQIRLALGDAAEARADSEAAAAAVTPDSPWWRQAKLAHAAALLAEGSADGCLETLRSTFGEELADLPLWDHPRAFALASRAAQLAGQPEPAARFAERATAAAATLGLDGQRGVAERAVGRLAEAPAETLAHALRAIELSDGQPLEVAEGHLLTAEALIRLDETAQAESHLAAAEEIARTSEAHELRRTVQKTRNRAVRPCRPEAEQFVLSQREYEISSLISQGRTNRQIARQLDVSHKTVETHLGRIFTKLNVRSRAEIANLIGRDSVVARSR